MRSTFAILLVLFSSTLPAAETSHWSWAGNWEVRVDFTTMTCYTFVTYEEGAVIRVQVSTDHDFVDLYIGSDSWRALQTGRTYTIGVRFGRQPEWISDAIATNLGGWPFLRAYAENFEPIDELIHTDTMTVYYRGEEIAHLSTDGAYLALMEMANCQDQIDQEYSDRDDPFSQEDPFAQ